jgi:hypothetical protein
VRAWVNASDRCSGTSGGDWSTISPLGIGGAGARSARARTTGRVARGTGLPLAAVIVLIASPIVFPLSTSEPSEGVGPFNSAEKRSDLTIARDGRPR